MHHKEGLVNLGHATGHFGPLLVLPLTPAGQANHKRKGNGGPPTLQTATACNVAIELVQLVQGFLPLVLRHTDGRQLIRQVGIHIDSGIVLVPNKANWVLSVVRHYVVGKGLEMSS